MNKIESGQEGETGHQCHPIGKTVPCLVHTTFASQPVGHSASHLLWTATQSAAMTTVHFFLPLNPSHLECPKLPGPPSIFCLVSPAPVSCPIGKVSSPILPRAGYVFASYLHDPETICRIFIFKLFLYLCPHWYHWWEWVRGALWGFSIRSEGKDGVFLSLLLSSSLSELLLSFSLFLGGKVCLIFSQWMCLLSGGRLASTWA